MPPCLNDAKNPGPTCRPIEKTHRIQPEFLHEVPDLAVHRHSEMTQDDTYEQNPCDSERDAADFDFSEQNADGDDQCEGQHGMGDAAAEEQGV